MFDSLTNRLGGIFEGLRGRGVLSDKDVNASLREIRVALLEADVALPVVKDFIAKVRTRATGEEVIRSVKPGHQVVKIVHDSLVDLLGGEDSATGLRIDNPPAIVMLAGLQGSGKTTTAAKIAAHLAKRDKKTLLLASLDTRRPAAMEQLATLASQAGEGVSCLPIVKGQTPVEITRRALQAVKLGGYDVLILDTAGRTAIDEQMMLEVKQIAALARPNETLLIADSLTGQDAVETARRFHERLPLTGLVLTRMDGDGRGGAVLSMRAVTGLPVKWLGTGEKLDGLDVFDAKRLAGRILGQGDIVALVEKARDQVDDDRAEKLARKMAKGQFSLDEMAAQFRQMQAMGGLGSIVSMLPGAKKAKMALDASGVDDRALKRQEAIILSMTRQERAKPALLNASRRKRIAAGAGVQVADVNKVLKMHRQMADMMKKAASKGGLKSMMAAMNMPPGAHGGLSGGIVDPALLPPGSGGIRQ